MGQKKHLGGVYLSIFLFFGIIQGYAQSVCTGAPSFAVDLTSSPYAIWDSPSIVRSGQCCGSSNNCVEFIVQLHPLSGGITLQITSGAIPPGAMYYRADCGASAPVGDSMCLTGSGPFHITFCKPGGNPNTYRISSFAKPAASPDLYARSGCSVKVWSVGFNETSIEWNSIYPGDLGDFNSWLNCTLHCDTVIFTPGPNPPPYIEYRVAGTPQNACSAVLADTVRIYLFENLLATLSVSNPVICFDSITTTVSCLLTGGLPPYQVLWSDGSTGFTAHLSTGSQWLRFWDQTNCYADTLFFNIESISAPPTVEAGDDIYVCYGDPLIELQANYFGAQGVVWSGGSGSFFPSNSSPHVWYQPSAIDRANGQVTLSVSTTDLVNCLPASDQVTIFFRSKPITSLIFHY